jgi:hypothetical protein
MLTVPARAKAVASWASAAGAPSASADRVVTVRAAVRQAKRYMAISLG